MKKLILILVIALSLNTYSQNNSIVMEGQFNGKNIFIKNTYGEGGRSFCITDIFVNGKITKDEINGNMIQIDLTKAGIRSGEKVKVEIKYKADCVYPFKPIVMNPGVLTSNDSGKESLFVIDGKFYWKNLYVSNPRIAGTNDFGVKEVLVNGKTISTNLLTDIFEINLVALGLQEKDPIKDGEKIKIEFKYQTGYDPLILNPEY